ncbi:hypothetical protein CERZMDRAFT_89929 [Cercospora zeae-maydis SCOH1-5]|uniref:Uncharacterized protein n=1 Tax=Cercospora zeae-maydis SCOH1-5 TaxID=717836 RepID=A0A6A6FT17_9PEZI|nr:hypothetical protein CERZMDRAFT_89929 [Cercospora zeae-maydis SCOH1-5]
MAAFDNRGGPKNASEGPSHRHDIRLASEARRSRDTAYHRKRRDVDEVTAHQRRALIELGYTRREFSMFQGRHTERSTALAMAMMSAFGIL